MEGPDEVTEFEHMIKELRDLPAGAHWFCPRKHDGDTTDYGEVAGLGAALRSETADIPASVEEADRRSRDAVSCLRILVLEREDLASAADWYKRHLKGQLGKCELCVKVYHVRKKRFVESLKGEHDEDEVAAFARVLAALDEERIRTGLASATETLRSLEPARRGLTVLQGPALFSIFEALSSDALLTDKHLMETSLDEPFRLVQTNRMLKLNDYVPAMGRFLFDEDDFHRTWAVKVWANVSRTPTKQEFWWVVQEPLLEAMRTASTYPFEKEPVTILWRGVKSIVHRLDCMMIRTGLRALEIDIFRLALDHLQVDSAAFSDIIWSLDALLATSSMDFWDAMGAISAPSVVEAICNAPGFSYALQKANESQPFEGSTLETVLAFIRRLVESLNNTSKPPACRAVSAQLMERFQVEAVPDLARMHCYETALAVISATLRYFVATKNDVGSVSTVERIVIGDLLSTVAKHIQQLTVIARLPQQDKATNALSRHGADVVRCALTMDSLCYKIDYDMLRRGTSRHDRHQTGSSPLWPTVCKALTRNDVWYAKNILLPTIDRIGIERLAANDDDRPGDERSSFRLAYDETTGSIAVFFDRLGDFDPDKLSTLFARPETAMPLIASLFMAEPPIHAASLEAIKVVSAQSTRREAMAFLVGTFFETTLACVSWSVRQVAVRRIFTWNPRMLKTSTDIFEVLCSVEDGHLNSRSLSAQESVALRGFWERQWYALTAIFDNTEAWGKVNDRSMMKEFCRDVMQFAEYCFSKYDIVANALSATSATNDGDGSDASTQNTAATKLLECPKSTLDAMVRWLRLRDEYLAEGLANLVKEMLPRLREHGLRVEPSTTKYIDDVCRNHVIRVVLQPQQKVELARALDKHLDRSSPQHRTPAGKLPGSSSSSTERKLSSDSGLPRASDKAGRLSQSLITHAGGSKRKTVPAKDDPILQASSSLEKYNAIRTLHRETAQAGRVSMAPARDSKEAELEMKHFRVKREKERQEKIERDQLQLALLKKNVAKAHLGPAAKQPCSGSSSMMVSSESEDEGDDGTLDEELFGLASSGQVSRGVQEYRNSKVRALQQAQSRGPVKKVKQHRNAKDMRARLTPDLSALHQVILSWDFFYTGQLPPGSEKHNYSLVTNAFKTPNEYQATFQPLLVLEAWQGFLRAKEESNFRPFELKVASNIRVDHFIDIASSMSPETGRSVGLSEADVILLSRAESPARDAEQPHALARVMKIVRKKAATEVTYRLNMGNPLRAALSPNSTVKAVKLSSIVPLEREYGALLGLQYYDLCDEIIRAKPSPLLTYTGDQLSRIAQSYSLNTAQSKALRSAVDNDGFTLIQGPPGSGKTKTIVAIVGALLTRTMTDSSHVNDRPRPINGSSGTAGQLASKKLLVCAPSNAAVDELVMRFKEGVRTLNGKDERISVVRLGRSDAINANVIDVTLDELVGKRLESVNGQKTNHGEEIHKLVEESRALTESQNLLRRRIEETRAKGGDAGGLQRDWEIEKHKKAKIGSKIDELRDKSSSATRDVDINRRRIQQEILDGAHIICATLSGSGHDMFQKLSIEFETVIIDEAAQSIELSALIPLKYGCSKCILVGDPKQLPPTVLSREAARFLYEQSLFVRMQTNHPDDVHLLDTQYRMHPDISRYPSQAFYDGKLLDGASMGRLRQRPWHRHSVLGPYRFFDVQGQHQSAPKGHSLVNVAELDVALQLYERLTTDFRGYDFSRKIGVITPYKGQLNELKIVFGRRYGESIFKTIEFNTTDAFQGRESEIIIFSCVRASPSGRIGFLDDIRRMNVGLTRAKCSLWVLGNSRSLSQNEFWGKLIGDARERDRYSGGDVLRLLGRPLPADVEVVPEEEPASTVEAQEPGSDDKSSTATTDGPDVVMVDAPALDAGNSRPQQESRRASEHTTVQTQYPAVARAPAGAGLNANFACHRCGSLAHLAARCDKKAPSSADGAGCWRCGGTDHVVARCAAIFCTRCGRVGHTDVVCQHKDAYRPEKQAALRRKEREYEDQRRMHQGRQQQRQVGDHDPRVPSIQRAREGAQAPGPNSQASKQQATRTGLAAEKRKRVPSPPPGLVPAKSADVSAARPAIRPPDGLPASLNPHLNTAPGVPSAPHVPGAPFVPGVPIAPGGRPGPPPPIIRRRKEVDPFIRPKAKKPRA